MSNALTVWPFIFINKHFFCECWATTLEQGIAHEQVHLAQQRKWFIYGLGVGLLVWWFLYLFCLPFYWNPWRRKWEIEAYQKGEGYSLDKINKLLKDPPYYLV